MLADSRFLALCTVALALSSGCDFLTATDYVETDDNSVCRELFGFGSVANGDGLCETVERPLRCSTRETFPTDLFTDPVKHKDTIVFGNLMDQTSATHLAREDSARLAYKSANQSGGLAGRNFGVVFCTVEENPELDTATRDEAPVVAARYLIDDLGVAAIVGPAASKDAENVFREFSDDGDVEREALIISPSATALTLRTLDPVGVNDDNPGLLWSTAPPDDQQASIIAADMTARLVAKLAIIFEDDNSYGTGLADEVERNFGGSVVRLPYAPGNDTLRSESVTTAGAGDFDEVLFVSSNSNQITGFLDAANANGNYGDPGANKKTIFLPDAGANPVIINPQTAYTGLYPYVRGSRPKPLSRVADPVHSQYLSAYAAEYDGRDVCGVPFTAHAYDAAWLLMYGTAWAWFQEGGQINERTIAKGLRQVSNGDTIEIRPTNWNAVKQKFEARQSFDTFGASGPLDFDPVLEETSGEIELWHVVGNAPASVNDAGDPCAN